MKDLKDLPKNFTDEEHAAWVRYHDKKEKRTEIIAGIIVYGGMGAWLLYCYFTTTEHNKDVMIWFVIGGFALYSLEKRLIAIDEKLERISERLRRN